MKFMRISIILLLLLIISIASVSATEDIDDIISNFNEMELDNTLNDQSILSEDSYTSTKMKNNLDSADSYTFTELKNDIDSSESILNLEHDYTFNNESDSEYILINKDNFIINGNNHILNGNNQVEIFNITGNNVTLNNLLFLNGNASRGGAIYSTGNLRLNNLSFINNNAERGGAIANMAGTLICNNTQFIDNLAERGSSILSSDGQTSIFNSSFKSNLSNNKYGQVYATKSKVEVVNVDFINMSSDYSPALHLEYCENSIINSTFINLTANISAGAISIKSSSNSYIKGCKFINTKSFRNAGAIIVDHREESYNATIIDCVFDNDSSMIGGAYIQLGGNLFLINSNFTNNKASQNSGAIFISFTNSTIDNCIFSSNTVESSNRFPYGGAIYCDFSNLSMTGSKFIKNSAYQGNGIYACDSTYDITNSLFANNSNAIYTDFDKGLCNLENNEYNGDSVITNETYSYKTFIDSPSLELEFINNTVNLTEIPSKLDLRDYGWVSPVKDQGIMGSCWTFGIISAVESAILKGYGLEFDLSEDNLFHNMLRYFPYGCISCDESGLIVLATSYLVDWFGPVLMEEDIYDEIGKLSPFLPWGYDVVHIQDIVFIPNDDASQNSKIKSAIMNYGSLAACYASKTDAKYRYYNPETYAHYVFDDISPSHVVSVIGWDDDYSAENFLVTPPGNGAWIVKNSWGSEWGDEGVVYISYYDKSFSPGEDIDDYTYGIILDNTIPYNKNYQHDFTWEGDFKDLNELKGANGKITYANQFIAAEDDLIAALGSYFNESGINYTVEIYVNDKLQLRQDGISPFFGFHTIKLNEYVSVKSGDIFKVVISSNAMPSCFSNDSRVHYSENLSFLKYGDEWIDLYSTEGIIASLKAYTLADDSEIINNKDIVLDYGSKSYFNISVVSGDGHPVVGAPVEFKINGKVIKTTTDDKGIAKLKITELPGKYIITTSLNNQSYENTVTVNGVPDKDNESDENSSEEKEDVPEKDKKNGEETGLNHKSTSTKILPANDKRANHTYALYRASDMKLICISNVINLTALIDLFDFNLTNGHLKVYIDGVLVFDGDVDDDLSRVIIEIIEKFLGKHEMAVEFTDNNGKTHRLNETIIIENELQRTHF